LFVDGVVARIRSTLDRVTGLVPTLGIALSTADLSFVMIATAKGQVILAEHRWLLGKMFGVALYGLMSPAPIGRRSPTCRIC
jgi:hypothetical protein